jgi:hypothetical protein
MTLNPSLSRFPMSPIWTGLLHGLGLAQGTHGLRDIAASHKHHGDVGRAAWAEKGVHTCWHDLEEPVCADTLISPHGKQTKKLALTMSIEPSLRGGGGGGNAVKPGAGASDRWEGNESKNGRGYACGSLNNQSPKRVVHDGGGWSVRFTSMLFTLFPAVEKLEPVTETELEPLIISLTRGLKSRARKRTAVVAVPEGLNKSLYSFFYGKGTQVTPK